MMVNGTNASMDSETWLNETQLLGFDPDSSQAYVIMRRFQTVLIPFICLIGIIGNVLAATVLLSPTLRRASCCLYLAAKSSSDIGFLVSLFIMWLYRIHVPLLNTQGVCQITVFLSYVCGFLSVWFVIAITFENFIRIAKPWRVAQLCSQRKAVIFIVAILVFTCSLYSFSLWSTGIIPDHNPACQSLDKYRNVALAMTYLDTSLTLLLPSVVMLGLITAITFCVLQAYRRKSRLLGKTNNGNGKPCSPEGKVSRFLFAVSITFLLLHTPSHVVRMRLMIMSYVQHHMPSSTDLVVQRLFEMFFYCNFALNCVICLIFGDNFRRMFREMYFGRCQQKHVTEVHSHVSHSTSLLLMNKVN